jgi:hypothetical protein
MKFTVTTAAGAQTYDGEYQVKPNGVLKIIPASGASSSISLAPAFWHEVRTYWDPVGGGRSTASAGSPHHVHQPVGGGGELH